MKFKWTIIYVPDVPQTVAFYEKAFGIKRSFVHESNQYAEMDTGATTLAFASDQLAQSNFDLVYTRNNKASAPAGVEIAFVTDDVAVAFKRAVAAGAEPIVDPKLKPWGQTVSFVRDQNGVLVEIASPVPAQ